MNRFLTKNRLYLGLALLFVIALVFTLGGDNAYANEDDRHVLHVLDRANSWDGIDIHRDGLQAGDVLIVYGRIDGAVPAGAQMVLGGAESPWNWAANMPVEYPNQAFFLSVELEEMHLDEEQFVRFRIQTNGEGSSMDFFVYGIIIERGEGVFYSLQEDEYIQTADGGATDLNDVLRLQQSGGASIIITPPTAPTEVAAIPLPAGDFGILHITNRTADWHALDIHREPLEIGDHILVLGRTGGAVADDTSMLLGGGFSPWNWITSSEVSVVNEEFELSFTLEENHFDEEQFERIRIQSNAAGAAMSFFIDDIVITRGYEVVYSLLTDSAIQENIGSVTTLSGHQFLAINGNPTITAVPTGTSAAAVATADDEVAATGPLQNLVLVTFDPGVEFAADIVVGEQMDAEVVSLDGNYAVRMENVTGNYTSGDGNYLVLYLEEPLPVGSTVEISWDVFVPSAYNPGNRTIMGPGININGQFGSAPHQPTNTDPEPGDLARIIPMDEWVNTTVEFTTGLAVGDIEHIIFRFRVNNNEQQPSVLYMDNISISTRGVAEVFVPTFDLNLPSLAELFADYFMIGNIWSNPIQMGIGNTEEAFVHHFNAITAENHHKPSFIAAAGSDPAQWTFDTQDAIVDFAEEHGQNRL